MIQSGESSWSKYRALGTEIDDLQKSSTLIQYSMEEWGDPLSPIRVSFANATVSISAKFSHFSNISLFASFRLDLLEHRVCTVVHDDDDEDVASLYSFARCYVECPSNFDQPCFPFGYHRLGGICCPTGDLPPAV
jgi:hypothetical protein